MGIYTSILNEVYIGKKASLKKMEEVIHNLREPYLQDKGNNFTGLVNIQRDPNLALLEKMLEEEFGFKNLYLSVSSKPCANAWTYPIDLYLDTSMDMGNLVVTSNTGYKFKPIAKAASSITLTSKLLFDPRFTDAEILAIILHEVGHNFQSVMNGKLRSITQMQSFIIYITAYSGYFLNLLYVSNSFKDFENNIKRNIVRNNGLGTIIGFGSMISAVAAKILNELIGLTTIGTLGLSYMAIAIYNLAISFYNPVQILIDFIYNIPGKGKENLADSFCYIYGYGTEQISALAKMESMEASDIEDMFDNVPVLSSIKDLFSYPALLLMGWADPHPKVVTRCKNIINDCKYDINNIEDPRVRKELLKQLDTLEKMQNKLFVEGESLNDNLIVKKAVLRHLAGKDYKENIFSTTGDMEYEFRRMKEQNKHKIDFY